MTAPIRVLHLSVVHKQDEPRIYERECRSLAQAGFDVVYLAPGAEDRTDEYGVRVMSLPVRPRARRWMSSREILAAVRDLRPRVVHVHDPELLTLFPLLKLFVPRLVYDMHEFVPEQVLSKEYLPLAIRPAVSKATALAQRTLAAFGDGVVTAHAHEDMLKSLGRRPRLRIVAPNYPRLSRFADAAPIPEFAADQRLRLVYIGGLARLRGCTVMLDVMERLRPDEAVLLLGGTFTSRDLEAETLARIAGGLHDRVHFLGRVPPPELPRYLASAEVIWIPSQPSVQLSRPSTHSKIYEGMAVGLAALVSDLPEKTSEVVRRERCGVAVAPDVEGHLAGVRRLLAERDDLAAMGERGQRAVREHYSWESVEGTLIDFYRRLG
jgi:glycosyltransferase involved in cell wall biosynthesis